MITMRAAFKHILSFLCILLVPFASYAAPDITTTAKQASVVDFETGIPLLEKNAQEQMPTSSMSKVITIYMVFEALKNGTLSLNDKLPVSEKAWRKGGSKMFVEVDKYVRVEDLIRGVIVQSGNDATIVLAEGLAGSEDAFADSLNLKAAELGMDNSRFTNASGWPDPGHYSTAEDLAKLGRAIIRDFPEYYEYYSEKEFTYNQITQKNRNPLLYRNIGADGIKTGHTQAGGYGLIGSGTNGERRVVVVVNGLEDEKERAREAAKLLEWGLRHFENHNLFVNGETIDSVDVFLGKQNIVEAVVYEDVTLPLPKRSLDDITAKFVSKQPLKAPIVKGQEIGHIEVDVPGYETRQYPVFAKNNVERLGFFSATLARAYHFFFNKDHLQDG